MLTEVHVPDDVSAAVRLLAGGATAIGGGTCVLPWLNDYASPPTELVSLRRAGLSGIRLHGDTVEIGAATTLAQVEHDDRLEDLNAVVRSIASTPVRNLATVGGNLFARQPHGDLAVALVALDARVTLVDETGSRELPVEELTNGAGLVTTVTFELPRPGTFRYVKAARRRYNSASLVTVAATVTEEEGTVTGARIALGGVGPRVIRAHAVEAALVGQELTADTVRAAGEAGRGEIEPADDAYASAWYRTRVFPVHLRRALLGH
ncbi:CO or xanthine dehydrogenase, FAD-binding subunit [Asanoa hainanensis]|uniref:CO or xanthine dehydrogenase, FAD-binding subunit n=1 Tax=Asanoa hainanensis TaxID=560556 RepID=A0A239H3M5_9ACTN|nr:FAD binding domain-containing protein [Asanoa hainanensis]SNS75413.1 CO or xanthine dehydrogenase, FAD-binding subunit [Asanoa hainanensis]